MDETVQKLAILYADVSESTRIYEEFGDKKARSSIRSCLGLLKTISEEHDGRLVKTIGDEVMCSFTNPVNAALAACDMQESLQGASIQGKFETGDMHIKIGWHYGEVGRRGGEIIGPAPVTAQQIIHLARKDEILTSEKSLESLPKEMQQSAHFVDSLEAEAYPGSLNVYAYIWEDDEAAVTKLETGRKEQEQITSAYALMLGYQGETVRLDASKPYCRIGRSPENDLTVDGKFTSRLHAEIHFKHGSYHLRDMSTNGTSLVKQDGKTFGIRREEVFLNGEGIICFGGMPDEDPGAVVHYKCINK